MVLDAGRALGAPRQRDGGRLMAHADYECCAVCDSKCAYAPWGEAKTALCAACVLGLADDGVRVTTPDDLLAWMESAAPDTVVAVLRRTGFRPCRYPNAVDAVWERLVGATERGQ
jgi:hypothetical protein